MNVQKILGALLVAVLCLTAIVTPVMAEKGRDGGSENEVEIEKEVEVEKGIEAPKSSPTSPTSSWQEFQQKQQAEFQSKIKEAQKKFIQQKQTCQKERVEFIKERNTKAQEIMKKCKALLPSPKPQASASPKPSPELTTLSKPQVTTCKTNDECGEGFRCALPQPCLGGKACSTVVQSGRCVRKNPTDDYRACMVKAQEEAKTFRTETTTQLKQKEQNCNKTVRQVLGLSTSVPASY